jgi:hypothetical protein
MESDTLNIARLTGGASVAWKAEGDSISPSDMTFDQTAFAKLSRRWKWWAGRHGILWRFKNGVEGAGDQVNLYARLSGDRRNRRADIAEAWLETHRHQVDELIASREPIPDPPLPRPCIDDVLARM